MAIVLEGFGSVKFCKKCNTEKSSDQFYKRSKSPDGLAYRCKDCHHKQFALPAPKYSYSKEYARMQKAKRQYNVSLEEYDEVISRGCQVCGSREKPCLDHDHTTMKVRGCLCHKCNTALGLLDDNSQRILDLYRYLCSTNKEV